MNDIDGFDLKNLEQDYFYSYPIHEKPKRSIKRKLATVFSFLAVLAITPTLLFGFTNINLNKEEKVSIAKDSTLENKKTINQEAENVSTIHSVEVINNDSYWKITKRVCGTGKPYLLVRDQNNGKALYKGDFVNVNCPFQ